MKNTTLALIFTVLLPLFTGLASAQHNNGHDDPATREWLKAAQKTVNESSRLVMLGRELLNGGKLGESLLRCDEAQRILDEAHISGGYGIAELYAEIYLARGNFTLVIEQAAKAKRKDASRLRMTEAIALAMSGKLREAKKIVLAAVGTIEGSSDLRKANSLWELPIDRGEDKDYIIATAYLIRGLSNEIPDELALPQNDYREAIKFAPRSPSVYLPYCMWLYLHEKPEEAKAVLAKAKAIAKDKRTQAWLETMGKMLRSQHGI